MSSSEAGAGDVRGEPSKQPSKWGKGKDTRITKDSASVKDRLALLEDILSKVGERYTEMADTFNAFNEDVRSMEESGVKRGEITYLAAILEVSEEDLEEEGPPAMIDAVLGEFEDIMPQELPKKLPPRREVDHAIELEPGAKPPAKAPYRMAPPELEELQRQLKDLLDAGFIKPSKAPYGAPVLFQRKSDRSLRLCIDYKALNKVTVKNKYPIPLVADLFDQLGGAKFFTKLDLRSVPRHAIRPDECAGYLLHPDEQTIPPYLDRFVVVYLDDIVVYSNTLEEHVEHLRTIFQVLWENQLYVKGEVLLCEGGGALPWPLDRPRTTPHGQVESAGDLRVGGAHDGVRAAILSQTRQLLSPFHRGLLHSSSPFDRSAEEDPVMGLDPSIRGGIRGLKAGGDGGSGVAASRLQPSIRGTY
uniref:Reverse transcriptase domain-containing protein n=1 Tax=Ananas comosus var. bracteatus TaxID=296719 RepID=A0A6V7NFE2_ANACO|nr:unnamed protein product [Ananas comosus var. bracteatus]